MKVTAPDSLTSTVTFNVIPLGFNPRTVECSFFESRKSGIISAPLQPDEMPAELKNRHSSSLYTDFRIHPNAPETSVIHLEESPGFAAHYLNWRIYQWFKDKARLRRRNFVNQNEFCFLKHRDEKNHIATFDRYTLKAGFGQITDGAELTITYTGETKIWLKSVLKYPGSTKDIKYVAYKGHIYLYKHFFKGRRVDRNKVYPVINHAIASELDLPSHFKKINNKIKRHTAMTEKFYKTYIADEDFIRQFQPAEEGFLAISKDDLKRISPDAANLEFGKGIIEKDPHSGMKKGGPYQPPDTSHFKLFFIVSEEDKHIANKLFMYLRDGLDRFPGLSTYAQIPVHFDEQHITFIDTDNPYPEVRDKLKEMEFEEDIQYGAIYISPISKFEKDPHKFQVYYKVKEELLKHRITSQCVYRNSINDRNFQYFLPNISVALLAKLDGIPWTLEQKPKKELVIGVSAYSPNHFRKTYLGSAFCFSNSGEFRGFDSFSEDDHYMLAGSFQKAIKHFNEEHEGIERIVIHFYKKMNKRESQLILNALKEMQLKVPVVILTIHKSGSTDFVLTDTFADHGLPLSGTYVRSGERQFLLCNNTRYTHTEKGMQYFPFPLKVYFDLAGGDEKEIAARLSDERWVYELLEQVYQFSRLNWNSITVGNMPVTIRYPAMIAHNFPYFAGDTLPGFGRKNFWFL